MKTENEEFNLSEREKIQFIQGIELNLHYYKISDVKEFIRRLKEELFIEPFEGSKFAKLSGKECNEIIGSLAGDKLI